MVDLPMYTRVVCIEKKKKNEEKKKRGKETEN
jgi:hypothetical protein